MTSKPEALFDERPTDVVVPLSSGEARLTIEHGHYLHSFPSAKTWCYRLGEGVLVFAIPANQNLARYLFGGSFDVLELSRLWAPDGHERDLLTRLIAGAASALRHDAPRCEAICSFADPSAGHYGGVYQAASWIYTGQSSERRGYATGDGRIVARRAFHSGSTSYAPSLPAARVEGKHRYVRPLTRRARRALRLESLPYPKPHAA